MNEGTKLALEHIEKKLASMERAPSTWGDMRTIEMVALALIELRQTILRPKSITLNPFETRTAYIRWIATINGETTNQFLFDVLKTGNMLDRLPNVMCDFGRWIAEQYPPE